MQPGYCWDKSSDRLTFGHNNDLMTYKRIDEFKFRMLGM